MTTQAQPFIRWAGSKRLMLRNLRSLMPDRFGTYIEPFLGGGSLYLATEPERCLLGDALAPLVATWRQVKEEPNQVLEKIESWDFNRETYLALRSTTFSDEVEIAAQFLYLNRGAYGGLWRVNGAGTFNVPWSEPKTPSPIKSEQIYRASKILRASRAEVVCGDFHALTKRAKAGDFVFLDPPYSKGRSERPFIHYNQSLFDWPHQIRLAEEAERLRSLGAHVLVSNSAHPEIADLYPGFERVGVTRSGTLASKASTPRQATESIFVSR